MQGKVDTTETTEIYSTQENRMDQANAFLFSNWDLDAIIATINTQRDDEFSFAVERLQQGQFDDANHWFETEISRFPWVLLAAASVRANLGDTESAIRYLRSVTILANDSLLQLWAWHNLRKFGRTPPTSIASQVLGIVIEVPNEDNLDILASYADGTARYINHQGGVILWEDFDNTISPLIFEGIRMARPMGDRTDLRENDLIHEGEVRLTILTPGGMYIWQGSPEEGSDVSRLFAQQATLLRELVQMTLRKRNSSDE
jgi:hypothetical protein